MQRRPRKPNEIAQQLLPLMLAGIGLVATSNSFTFIDDETSILGAAARPVRETLGLFWSGTGQHEHPPLFDILLHFWLRMTGGAFEYLRLPPIVFYVVGFFLLARVAKHLADPASAQAVVWLGALWPFGFHYGRLDAWYSFSFMVVAAVTLAYLRYLEVQTFKRWLVFVLLGAALLWTNYFGWAVLACLGFDQYLRRRAGEPTARPSVLAQTAAVWCVAFLPLLRAFRYELGFGVNVHHRVVAVLANAVFCFYSLFVSESMAPWHWILSIPAGLAVLVCMALVLTVIPKNARRFLLYGFFLFVVMALSGILMTKRMLLISPWIILPIGIAISATKPLWARIALPVSLLIIGGIGWYGIYAKRYYSAPRFLEPWPRIAEESSMKIQGGATVIANNPSFFFYLTYIRRDPPGDLPWRFEGVLPDQVKDPRVLSPEEWLASGHPVGPSMVWVRGMGGPQPEGSMDEAAKQLGTSCGAQNSRLMMRDEGYAWKQRFFPELGELQWRVEVRDYDCSPGGSQEIYRIPNR